MHKHGGDIYTNKNKIDFSANLNPLGMPDFISQAAKEAVDFSSVYPDTECRKLTEAIAKREKVNKENIICTNGAAELIFGLCFALKPKKAVLMCPSFEEYRQALRAIGCEIENYFLKEEMSFKPDFDFLNFLTDETDIVFICNPNNPTGKLMDKSLMNMIIEKCKKNNIFLVVDECFNDFIVEGKSVSVKEKGVFILKAFTKMYGMAGLRLGYGIYYDIELLNKIRRCIQPWSVSVVAQAAGTKAAEDRLFFEKTIKLISGEREFMLEELSCLAYKVYGWDANYIFFKAGEDLGERLLEKGFIIRDCSNFIGLSKGFYRIAIKSHEDNLKLISAWKEVQNG